MQGAEDSQGNGDTQVAQSYDFVQAASSRRFGPGSPQRNQEKQDVGFTLEKLFSCLVAK